MDHNQPCLWRTKSCYPTSTLTEEEVQSLLTDKAKLEKELKISDDKISSAFANCDAKNELVKKHANIAQEAFAGWEKAEAVAVSLKQELDVALQDKVAREERLTHLEAALKATRDFVFFQKVLEDELSDTNAKLGKLGFENAHLSKALLMKERLIKNLNEQKNWAEEEFNALVVRFGLAEKDNASLKYEVQLIEKELEMKNEERNVNRRTTHASHTRNLNSVKKIIAKSESEGEMINFLTEQLCIVDEENKSLKANLDKKIDELKVLKAMYTRSVSKLSQVESLLEQSPQAQKFTELTRSDHVSNLSSDIKVICMDSWASTLNFARVSGSNLMDDFVEIEKLAIADKSTRSSHSYLDKASAKAEKPKPDRQLDHCHADGCIFRTNKISVMDSSGAGNGLRESISKIIELIEGTGLSYSNGDTVKALSGKDEDFISFNNLETSTGYVVRVFQWKFSELGSVLQSFIDSCNKFLSGTSNLQSFVCELTSALDWIMNHCFSLQDVSSMRDKIKKHYGWDDTRDESESEIGIADQLLETDKILVHNVQLPSYSAWSNPDYFSHTEEVQANTREENQRLKDELAAIESSKKALERMLQSSIHQSDSLMSKSLELEKNIASLQKELATLKESKGIIEDQAENHKMMIENLATQLQIVSVELDVTRQRLASIEIELESKNYCYEDLEGTCLELQLQLESVTKKENSSHDMERDERQLQTDMEIITASEKLAECQATIQSPGKQLKALASPIEASHFDKVIFSPSHTTTTSRKNMPQQRCSLLDQMLADDDDTGPNDLKSLKANGMVCSSNLHKPTDHMNKRVGSNGIQNHKDEAAIDLSAIVPANKRGGGGLWRKLLSRRKKDY